MLPDTKYHVPRHSAFVPVPTSATFLEGRGPGTPWFLAASLAQKHCSLCGAPTQPLSTLGTIPEVAGPGGQAFLALRLFNHHTSHHRFHYFTPLQPPRPPHLPIPTFPFSFSSSALLLDLEQWQSRLVFPFPTTGLLASLRLRHPARDVVPQRAHPASPDSFDPTPTSPRPP